MLTSRKDRLKNLATAMANAVAGLATAEFNEEDHPRGADGKFGSGGGGKAARPRSDAQKDNDLRNSTGYRIDALKAAGKPVPRELTKAYNEVKKRIDDRQELKNGEMADKNLRQGGHTVDHNDLPYDFKNFLKNQDIKRDVWDGASTKERKDLVKDYLSESKTSGKSGPDNGATAPSVHPKLQAFVGQFVAENKDMVGSDDKSIREAVERVVSHGKDIAAKRAFYSDPKVQKAAENAVISELKKVGKAHDDIKSSTAPLAKGFDKISDESKAALIKEAKTWKGVKANDMYEHFADETGDAAELMLHTKMMDVMNGVKNEGMLIRTLHEDEGFTMEKAISMAKSPRVFKDEMGELVGNYASEDSKDAATDAVDIVNTYRRMKG